MNRFDTHFYWHFIELIHPLWLYWCTGDDFFTGFIEHAHTLTNICSTLCGCIAAVIRGKCDVFIRNVHRTIVEWKCLKFDLISTHCIEKLHSYSEKIMENCVFSQKSRKNCIHMSRYIEWKMENSNLDGQQLATPAPPREYTIHAHTSTIAHTRAHTYIRKRLLYLIWHSAFTVMSTPPKPLLQVCWALLEKRDE